MRVGRADHAGENCGLARRQLMNPLAEVRTGRGPHAPEGQSARLAQIDLVEICLEDLVLGIADLDEQSQPGLLDLAQHRPAWSEEPALDELLGEGASALCEPSGARVRPRGARETSDVDGPVVEEATILGGENGAHEDGGYVSQSH